MKAFVIRPEDKQIQEMEIPADASVKDLNKLMGTNKTKFYMFGSDNDCILVPEKDDVDSIVGFRFLNAYIIKNRAVVIGTGGRATSNLKTPAISLDDLQNKIAFCTRDEIPNFSKTETAY